MMYGHGKSSPVIVAGKPANKAQPDSVTAAESVERRAGAKGNADQPATYRTQCRARVALALASIRQAALDRQNPRWEPYAGKLRVRVCAGGARQLASLPRRAIRRRDFIADAAGAMAWPLAARAQQAERVQVIGFLHSGSRIGQQPSVAAFRQGLNGTGYVEGRNLVIEYRWAGRENGEVIIDRVVSTMAEISGNSVRPTGFGPGLG